MLFQSQGTKVFGTNLLGGWTMRERLIFLSRIVVFCGALVYLSLGHPSSKAQESIGDSVPVMQARQAEKIYDLDEHIKELENLEADRNTETHKELDDIKKDIATLKASQAEYAGAKDILMWLVGLAAAGGLGLQITRNRKAVEASHQE